MSPLTLMSTGIRTLPAYTGPGDVVASALGWWGVRAYSQAKVGTNAIRLRANDTVESDFITLSTGALDASSISTFQTTHGAPLTVAKLYDQTGNGNDFVQATAAAQPAFSLTLGPGSTPTLSFPTLANVLLSNATLTRSGSYSISTVARFDQSSNAPNAALMRCPASFQFNYVTSTTNQVSLAVSSAFAATQTDNVLHSIHGVYVTAASIITVDGTDTAGDVGALFNISGNIHLFQDGGAGSIFTGIFQEIGLWPGGFSGTDRTNLNSNQHTYWGF